MARVLIVDDERLIRHLLVRVLSSKGYECEVAASTDEAAEIVGRQEFDVVILDVDMPGGSGFDLVPRLRSLNGKRPAIVMMSGIASATVAADALNLGVEGYLVKPFPLEEAVARVEEALAASNRPRV